MDHQSHLQLPLELYGSINQYVIYKKFNVEGGCTYNQFYSVYQSSNPNQQRDLLMLKVYVQDAGYRIQKQVFESVQYSLLLVSSCDQYLYQNHATIRYNVLNIMKNGSLIQFLRLVKTVPMAVAKYFFRSILTSIDIVNKRLQIKHPTLYASDILVSNDMKPIVVGWSKINEPATEKQLLYDACDIFYTMVYGHPIKTITMKNNNKHRYLDKKQWDNFKKTIIKDSKNTIIQTELLLQIFQSCLVKQSNALTTIQNILKHKFFTQQDEANQQVSELQAKQILEQLQKKKSSQKKEKSLKKIGILIKRAKNIQKQQADISGEDRGQLRDQFANNYYENVDILFSLKINQDPKIQIQFPDCQASSQMQQNQQNKIIQQKQLIQKEKLQEKPQISFIPKKQFEQNKQQLNSIALLITNLRQLLKQNIHKGLIFQQNIAKLHNFILVINSASTTQKLILSLKLTFQFHNQQSKMNEYQTIDSIISIKMDQKIVNVDIPEFRFNNFYISSLKILLIQEIQILLNLQS